MNTPEDAGLRLRTHVHYLAGVVGERNSTRYASLEQARTYIEREFTRMDYRIQHDAWEVSGRTYRNVIAELPGSGAGVVIIGAHYDTARGTPGADDNASSVAVLLELARRLRDFVPAPAIRWAAFTLEEPPYYRTTLMGSRIHALKCRERVEQIVCMISLEMTGYYTDVPRSQWYPLPFLRWFYPDRGNFIALAGNFRSRHLVSKFAGRMSKAGSIPVVHTRFPFVPGAGLSDNWSFWKEGYLAFMITDTAFFRNPNYHSRSDSPETLDFERMANLVYALDKAIRSAWGI